MAKIPVSYRNRIRISAGYRVFSALNGVLLFALAAVCVLPFLHLAAVSFSSQAATAANRVGFVPIGPNLNAYVKALRDSGLLVSFTVTLRRMALGTFYGMLLTVLVAYPLSFDSRTFPGRTVYVVFFFVSMLFSGGIIPYYILITDLKLTDTIWALVLGAVPVGNVIILMNFFRQLPKTIYESAVIDGAGHLRVLWKMYLPLSMPSVATLVLFGLVAHWNEWFSGMIFMKYPKNYPLQTFIQAATADVSEFVNLSTAGAAFSASRQSVIAAMTCFAMIPILLAYPLLQKHIKSGLILGSVKE